MKILQITPYYPPSLGGIQFFVQSLSRHLECLGNDIDILTINTDQAEAVERTPEGVLIRRCKLDLSLYRALISGGFLQRLLTSDGYDIYHIHIPFHIGLEAAVIASKRNHIPLVATHHGQGLNGSPIYTILASSYCWMCQAFSLRGVDRLIFLTPSYAQSIWLPESVRQRTRIVQTGTEVNQFSPNHDGCQIRSRYGLDAHLPLILFIGYLGLSNRYKGVDYLIKSLVKVREEVSNVKLMIVGDGNWIPQLKSLTGTLYLENNVIFTGPIDNQHLPGYYAAADVFALPSISGPENSPVVVFEAMASAKPVVASNLPGVRDIVQDGKTGLLVPPKDSDQIAQALLKFISDREFARMAGRNARKQVESYSWHHCVQEMIAIYRELL